MLSCPNFYDFVGAPPEVQIFFPLDWSEDWSWVSSVGDETGMSSKVWGGDWVCRNSNCCCCMYTTTILLWYNSLSISQLWELPSQVLEGEVQFIIISCLISSHALTWSNPNPKVVLDTGHRMKVWWRTLCACIVIERYTTAGICHCGQVAVATEFGCIILFVSDIALCSNLHHYFSLLQLHRYLFIWLSHLVIRITDGGLLRVHTNIAVEGMKGNSYSNTISSFHARVDCRLLTLTPNSKSKYAGDSTFPH